MLASEIEARQNFCRTCQACPRYGFCALPECPTRPSYHEAVVQIMKHGKSRGEEWWKGLAMLEAAVSPEEEDCGCGLGEECPDSPK